MSAKRVAMYLLASVFGVAIQATAAMSQSKDVNCDKQETLSDLSGKCSDDQQYNEIDRTITNSTTKGDDANSGGQDNSGDHDNGHGNDPDHDDSSNPGKGGGNHGTGNNGKGNGK